MPTLSATVTTVCASQTTTLSIATGNLNNATNWQWYSGSCGGTSVGNGASIDVSPTTTTTYFARGEGSCVTPGDCGSITITVDPVSVGGSIDGSATVCSGANSTTLTLSGQVGAIQKWQSSLTPDFANPTDIANTTTSLTATNLTQTTYYRAVVQSGVCAAAFSATATVNVNALPTLTPGPNQSVVFGYGSNCTDITATADGTGPFTFTWSGSTSTASTANVCPEETTTYTVTVTDGNGCTSAQAQVTVNVKDVRCGPDNQYVTICYYGVTQCVREKTAKNYLKLGATLGACGSPASRLSYEGTTQGPLALSLKAYPNPVQDAVTVEVLAPKAGSATFEVLDVAGRARQTQSRELAEGLNEVELRLGALPTGIYLIRLRDAAGRQGAVKVSKE